MPRVKLLTSFIPLAFLFLFYPGHGSTPASPNPATNPGAPGGTIGCLIDGKQKALPIQGFCEITLDFYSKGPADGILFANGDDNESTYC